MHIQLLTFAGCPGADPARSALIQVISEAGLDLTIEEIDLLSPLTPPSLGRWGSPTILVNGRDVEGQVTPIGSGCRLYRHDDGELRSVPPTWLLEAALRRAVPTGAA